MEKDTRRKQESKLAWKEELINELNELSEDSEKNKERMLEIAKVLVAEYYNYKK